MMLLLFGSQSIFCLMKQKMLVYIFFEGVSLHFVTYYILHIIIKPKISHYLKIKLNSSL